MQPKDFTKTQAQQQLPEGIPWRVAFQRDRDRLEDILHAFWQSHGSCHYV